MPDLHCKHQIDLFISIWPQWNSLKHDGSTFCHSVYLQARGVCDAARIAGTNTFLLISGYQQYHATFSLTLRADTTNVWNTAGLENDVWMFLQREKLSGKGSKEIKQPKENGNVVKSILLVATVLITSMISQAQIQPMPSHGKRVSKYSIVVQTIKENDNHKLWSRRKGAMANKGESGHWNF